MTCLRNEYDGTSLTSFMVLIYDANETFLLYLGILDLAFVFFFVVDVDVDESAHR